MHNLFFIRTVFLRNEYECEEYCFSDTALTAIWNCLVWIMEIDLKLNYFSRFKFHCIIEGQAEIPDDFAKQL